jgi:hypothetical protein
MRFVLLTMFITAVLSPFTNACGAPQLSGNWQIPRTFVYERGWEIPGLKAAKVVRTYSDMTSSTVIEHKPTENLFIDLQGFELSTDGKSLRLVPGYVQLVTNIFEYRIHEQTYAYDVVTVSASNAQPPMWAKALPASSQRVSAKGKSLKRMSGGILGCGYTTLRYFDTDGDGRFESMEYVGFGGPYSNSTQCPTFPEWALNLMPARAVAERCSKLSARGWEIPLLLKQLIERGTPPLPVLAP